MDQNHQPNLPLVDNRNKPRSTLSMPDMYRVARAFEKIRPEIKAHQYTNEKLIKYVAETLQLTVSRANVNTALEMIGLSLGTPRGGKGGARLNGDGYARIKALESRYEELLGLHAAVNNLATDLARRVDALERGLGVTKG